MIHPWNCDDDADAWDDSRLCWLELEDFAGPEYFMWRDKLDAESEKPTYRPSRSVFVPRENWTDLLC